MAEPEFLRRMKANLDERVHQPPAEAPRTVRPAFLEQMKMRAAEEQLGSAALTGDRLGVSTGQHPAPAPGAPPARVPANPLAARAQEGFAFQPGDVPAVRTEGLGEFKPGPDDRRDRGFAERILNPTPKELERAGALAARVGLETAGTMLGSVAAKPIQRLGVPILSAAAPTLGRAIGQGLGSLASQPVDPVDDPLGQAAIAAGFSVFGDGLAAAYYAGKNRLRARSLEAGARDAIRLLGPEALPSAGRLARHRGVDLAENIVESSLVGGGAVERRNALASAKARELIDEYVQKLMGGASRSDVDQLVSDIVEKRLGSFKASAEALYGKVDEIAGEGVDTKALINLRNKLVAEYQTGAKSTGAEQIVLAIDRTLGVPKSMRGVEKNVVISALPGKRFDPRKPGAIVIEGADTSAQNLGFPTQYEMDNITGEMIPARPGSIGRFTRGPGGGWVATEPTAREVIPFREMQKLRSDMLTMTDSVTDPFSAKAKGAAKLVTKVADDSMVASAAVLKNPEAVEFWRIANQFWKDGSDAFGEQVMHTLAKAKPDELFTTIMQGNHPQQVARFRKLVLGGVGGDESKVNDIRRAAQRVLRDPAAHPIAKELAQKRLDGLQEGVEIWQKFQGQLLLNTLRGADPGAGLLTKAAKGDRVLQGGTALSRWSDLGDDMLREVFPASSKRRQAERLLRTLEITQSGTGLGTGRIATQLAQAGAAFQLVFNTSLSSIGSGGAVIFGPAAVGKLMDNPRFISLVTQAGRARSVEETRKVMLQLALIAVRNGGRVMTEDGQIITSNEDTEVRSRFRATAGAAGYRGR